MNSQDFFARLWDLYVSITPQALKIHQLLEAYGERVVNDHIAFRTFDQSTMDLSAFTRALGTMGYEEFGRYQFPDKHLDALAFKTKHPEDPKVFVSEIRRSALSPTSQSILSKLIEQCSITQLHLRHLLEPCPWPLISYEDYLTLASESEYAAWLSVMGLRANHFTVSVNQLNHLTDLSSLNRYLQANGFPLNDVGGIIKGQPTVYLEQSSTLADQFEFTFSCGKVAEVPSCFYEFARRYPLADGSIFQGFVTNNAQSIFESTHRTV
jgi:hypothetical protein